MKIMESLRTFLFGSPPQRSARMTAKVDAAIKAADAVATQSREVNDKLKGYLDERDPFAALMIDISNQKAAQAQLSRWEQ